jgi:Anti-sigma factor NepR
MTRKALGKPRKRATKAAASLRESVEKADQYIADQLKAMYDSVVVEPVPDRLLELLDRLDSEAKE